MAVLVTGASRGIGAAIARRMAADGHDVAVHYHQDRSGAEATAAAVQASGQEAAVFQADIGAPEAAWRLAEEAIMRFPDLAVLVNNAGIYDRRAMTEMAADHWRQTMAVNLDGPAALCQALAARLRAADGCIVHISSIVAARGTTHGQHYAASKAALLGLTKAQALEWAPLRVNAICPGYIATDILADDTAEKRQQRAEEVPLGRIGTPEDVAGAVSFLCSRDAAYVTGQTIHVNGGLI